MSEHGIKELYSVRKDAQVSLHPSHALFPRGIWTRPLLPLPDLGGSPVPKGDDLAMGMET